MKKYHDTLKDKFKRLGKALLGQATWLIPLLGAGWYIQAHLSIWCDTYFGVLTARETADYLSRRTDLLSEPVLMTPGALWAYGKAFFVSTQAAAKAYTLASVSGLITGLGVLCLYLAGILAGLYALIRIRRACRRQRQESDMTNRICREIMPEIAALRAEVAELKALLAHTEHIKTDSDSTKPV